jgi:hypothetical protein
MSNFKVIGDIGETLKDLLNDDAHWQDITKPDITLKSPKEIKDQGENINIISIYLYNIIENIHFINKELQKIDYTTLHYPPMAIDLFYLLTPFGSDSTQEKYMLGKVMQIFYDNPVLNGSVLHGSLEGTDEEIKLISNPLSLDDLNKIWSTFQETGYRLSISYLVTPVMIDSIREMSVRRVVSTETGQYFKTQKKQG